MSDQEKKTPAEDVKADAPAAEAPKEEAAPKAEAPKAEEKAAPAPEAKKEEAKPAAATPATPAQGGGNNQGGYQGGQGGNNRGPGGNNRGGFQRRDDRNNQDDGDQLAEKVVFINRCSKVVKGGRRFSFSALVVVGDQEGKVGYGFGKANEVAECIKKAVETAKGEMEKVTLTETGTIPHEIYAEFGGGKVLLKPASPGTGVIAGGGVRAVCEAAGVKNVLAKSLGSNNHANVVKATLKALSELRSKEQVMATRGRKVAEKAI